MCVLLKLPWTCSSCDPSHMKKRKCVSIQVASRLAGNLSEFSLEVLDFGLHDEDEEVRSEAVVALPVVVFWSDLRVLSHVLKRLE